jgi:dihydrofolate reductase
MRKIILNLAMSLDGYIADENGGYAWIIGDGDKHLDTEITFDFSSFLEDIDIVVMGRKAYEEIGVKDYPTKKILVATSKAMDNTDHIEFVNNTIVERIQELQKEEGNNIWLFGGSGLTNQFMKADLVDEFIIGIIPTILGGGRPLFFDGNPMVNLHLDSYTIQEGLPILIYSRRVS